MKTILDSSANEAFDPAKDLRVLVAYLNSALALRAKAMLDRVGHQAGEDGRLICTLWDFKSLSDPALVQLAAEEAMTADIIVLAAQEGHALPRGVRDWIARWLLTKQEQPHALVASLHCGPEAAQKAPVLLPYLARVAEYGRMHFFAGNSDGQPAVDLSELRAELAPPPPPAGPLMRLPTQVLAHS